MATKTVKYAHDGKFGDVYVRAWREGRGRNAEIVVQVWKSGEPSGDPDGDWAMPAALGLHGAVEQAILQTD